MHLSIPSERRIKLPFNLYEPIDWLINVHADFIDQQEATLKNNDNIGINY